MLQLRLLNGGTVKELGCYAGSLNELVAVMAFSFLALLLHDSEEAICLSFLERMRGSALRMREQNSLLAALMALIKFSLARLSAVDIP